MTYYQRAPRGNLEAYDRESFTACRITHDVYRQGDGPAVLVLTELPGISPQVIGFADRVVAGGFTAVLPTLFGVAGRDPDRGSLASRASYLARSLISVCIRREFNVLVAGRSAPVISWLRALASKEHARCGGPGMGVVGMSFTGGFALAMATDARVLVPVLSQPSLPVALTRSARASIDCSPHELAVVKERCARGGLRVLGLRFHDDPAVPRERFDFLREQLGDAFVAIEIVQSDGHPQSPLARHHSVLTRDLIDVPGEPTRKALDRVLALLVERLHAGPRVS